MQHLNLPIDLFGSVLNIRFKNGSLKFLPISLTTAKVFFQIKPTDAAAAATPLHNILRIGVYTHILKMEMQEIKELLVVQSRSNN